MNPNPLPPEVVETLCTQLPQALRASLSDGGFQNPERWVLEGAALRSLLGRLLPVVTLRRPEATLCFLVTPTDPASPAYKRTRRWDVTYFSEDVPDDAQHQVFARDRATIDRFVAWLSHWEAPGGA
jgi:hypothetical protein